MSQTKKLVKNNTNEASKYKWKLSNSDTPSEDKPDDDDSSVYSDASEISDYYDESNTRDLMEYIQDKFDKCGNDRDEMIEMEYSDEYLSMIKQEIKYEVINGFKKADEPNKHIKYLSDNNKYRKKKYYYLIIKDCNDINNACKKRSEFMFYCNLKHQGKSIFERKRNISVRMISCNIKCNLKRTKTGMFDYHCLFEVNDDGQFTKVLNSIRFKTSLYWLINKYQYEEIRDKIQRMKH